MVTALQVMDLQQEAMAAATEDEVLRMREENGERRNVTVKNIAAAFEQNNLAQAAKLVHKLTYWNRVEAILSEQSMDSV
jgi:ABC-type phosphate transport system auxiliary subunit